MARRNPNDPPIKSRWKKGQSGNPEGGRAHDPHLKKLKSLTKQELVEIGNIVIKGNVAELKKIAADPKATVIQTMLAAISVKIINRGDMHALDILLNRLVGKVKDEVEYAGVVSSEPVQLVVTLPSNGKEAKDSDA